MSNYTFTADSNLLNDLQTYYQDFMVANPPPYSLFQAKKEGVTITAYQSAKVVFQGQQAEKEGQKWAASDSQHPSHSSSLPDGFENWSVLASDEVGNGSYFGPITLCAAYASQDKLKLLRELGVKDSKNLSDKEIKELAWQIKACLPYKLLVVSPKKYNSIQPQMSQHKMKALLHNQALALVLDQIYPQVPQGILIDQFEEAAAYFNHIKDAERQITEHIYFEKRAESLHLAVAAASIIARDQFLIEMEGLSNLAGMSLHIGANAQVDQQAAQIIQNPQLDLANFAKIHFANTRKAEKLAQK